MTEPGGSAECLLIASRDDREAVYESRAGY